MFDDPNVVLHCEKIDKIYPGSRRVLIRFPAYILKEIPAVRSRTHSGTIRKDTRNLRTAKIFIPIPKSSTGSVMF